MASRDKPASPREKEPQDAAPSISLPKGGGAIRGIGDKFAANPVTGTGSVTIPIAASPGRSGFGPQLSLSYDSGSGNGPFGFGWNLEQPRITRKTDKGLPRYCDAEESDVFILSGAEDLVPLLEPDGSRHRDETIAAGYVVERYRPRIEGLFARIERWTRLADGDIHWRTISRENVLTLYGADVDSRIADPGDRRRIFSWLVCEARDDRGNAILYGYAREDGVGCDLVRACERNRGDANDPRRGTNRYLKRIRYGNRNTLLDNRGRRPRFLADLPTARLNGAGWMFELVLDYGEHDADAPKPDDSGLWSYRDDPFSSYRARFEIRTTRLCRRVLMFHHIPDLPGGGAGYEGLVRSTDFTYSHQQDPASARNPVYTFLRAVRQAGYRRLSGGGYEKRSTPAVEFDYSEPIVEDVVEEVDPANTENLPVGLDDAGYRWTDLHGEGIPGILTEQAGAFLYKRNLSPIGERKVMFGPTEVVAEKPNLTLADGAQLMDLAGDGRPDLVVLDGSVPGFYEHDADEGWEPFRPFQARFGRDARDPNLRFVDLDGDGRADILITEDDAFVWHPGLGEAGFGEGRRIAQAIDEEDGPRLVFADSAQSIHLADLSGDGLADLVRIRNGEICYWPNLGYGCFGAKVAMDRAPRFDNPEQFDQRRVRLADIDGSGTTDIVYLHREGVRLYFNQSGNAWSEAQRLKVFPRVDDLASIHVADLLGNGTACLVWSSPQPVDARRPMRFVHLMGASKPHLLVRTINNLGAETEIRYAPSTKFYLQDRRAGRPWLTRLPFPVHVVERVETLDHVSRSRFVARYAYHHGYFDGVEREFRGFGMVEQWDTEEMAVLAGGAMPQAANVDSASQVPPMLTRSWFHTGLYLGRDHVSDFFAGLVDGADRGEYYREPGLTDAQARALLLLDTVLPPELTPDEEREACRALKGSMLRHEVYALDGTAREAHPYSVVEQNFSVRREQPRGGNRHGAFFVHPCEAITYHYERDPDDPRVQHAITLEVDAFGNVLKEAAIGYGRRRPDPALPLQADRDRQTERLVTYSENRFTRPIDDTTLFPDDYRAPLPCETRTYELDGYVPTGAAGRFLPADFVQAAGESVSHLFDTEIRYEGPPGAGRQRRPIEQVRILYRADDLTALLPLGAVGALALPGESYKLAFTPGLLARVFVRDGSALLSDAAAELGGQGGDRGGYLSSQVLKADGRFPVSDPDDHWWVPTGRTFLSPNDTDSAAQELAHARSHFFLPRRLRDPFHSAALSTESHLSYDPYDLLLIETRDAAGNRVSAGERKPDGTIDSAAPGNDYRVLQPALVTDPNLNRSAVAFDALGMVVGTALMGKPGESLGDSLAGFVTDLAETVALNHLADPLAGPAAILGRATTRLIYDLFAYQRTKSGPQPQPAVVCTLARETHDADLGPGEESGFQHSVSYSDGFGREIQKKIRAEPGPLAGGGPAVDPRWVCSGWTVFNNKGKPVRQYEPFFSATHAFEFDAKAGVSPILFYDPAQRVVATLHPNHSWEKVVFSPWRQESWDVNDTAGISDPKSDPDVRDFFARLPEADYLPGWDALRTHAAHAAAFAARYPDPADRAIEARSAEKTRVHAATPAIVHADALGRTFLAIVHNRFRHSDMPAAAPPIEEVHATRTLMDIEGNQREVTDARDRIVVRYDYDMLGNRIHQASMEAGERWMLADVAGKPLFAWDSRGHRLRTAYDPLRRPTGVFLSEGGAPEILIGQTLYGESLPGPEARNLRGMVAELRDQAGIVTSGGFDFKGNLLRGERRLAQSYKALIDWSGPVPLEPETYSGRTRYDALNRPTQLVAPHSDQPGAAVNLVQPVYNAAGLLEQVHAWLGQPSEPAGLLPPSGATLHAVTDIAYDAKGQRMRVDRGMADGNVIRTRYGYDPLTLRLTSLYTRRGVDPLTASSTAFTDDCENPAPPPATIAAPEEPPPGKACGLQNLRYSYDPAGNVTHIRDDAQQIVYFRNKRVEPSADYVYDALYRLIEATGREHLGQIPGAPIPHSHDDSPRTALAHPGDGQALGRYRERYVYDAVGNFEAMRHLGSDPAHPGWTRTYDYDEPSQIEPGTASNRLTRTTVGTAPETYSNAGDGYDAHGNMLKMPQLEVMQWDFADRLRMTRRQAVSASDADGTQRSGEQTWYIYDAAGERVRKVTESAAAPAAVPAVKEERLYLGGFEIYRRNGVSPLVRETLHIMDDAQRIALVETRTQGSEPGLPAQLVRNQFGNHLGSASLELDDLAQIISYEEYSPYGSTTYQAVRNPAEAPKRYRFTGKERDEESGLNYHEARYYTPWIGRWTASDPAGLVDGSNLYAYVGNNPVRAVDPTGTQSVPSELDDALSGALERLGMDEPFQAGGKAGSVPLTMDIDEPNPVGQKNISTAEARARAVDINNRQFLDPMTNRRTKWLGVDSRAAPAPASTVSVSTNPNALLTRKFGDIAEMKGIFNEAAGKIRNPAKLSPTKLKEAINKNIWDIIKTGTSDDAVKVRQALGQLGFQNVKDVGFVMQAPRSAGPISRAVAGAAKAAAPIAAKAAPVVAKFAPGVAKAAPVVKAVSSPLFKALGPVGIGVSAGMLATANSTEERVDAGIGLASGVLTSMRHPVAVAGGVGLMAGQVVNSATNASTHAANAGSFVYEGLSGWGLNDNVAWVAGGATTLVTTPAAIAYGAAARAYNWIFD